VKLIFFDEAKDDPDYLHYHVGGVCIDEKDLAEVEKAVSAIAAKAFGTADLTRDTELHAAEIFHRKKNFKDWTDFEKRIRLLGDVVEILSREDVQLINIQVNCQRLRGAQTADEIAFMFLCERANDLARSQKSLGMLIGRPGERSAGRSVFQDALRLSRARNAVRVRQEHSQSRRQRALLSLASEQVPAARGRVTSGCCNSATATAIPTTQGIAPCSTCSNETASISFRRSYKEWPK